MGRLLFNLSRCSHTLRLRRREEVSVRCEGHYLQLRFLLKQEKITQMHAKSPVDRAWIMLVQAQICHEGESPLLTYCVLESETLEAERCMASQRFPTHSFLRAAVSAAYPQTQTQRIESTRHHETRLATLTVKPQ